VQHPTTPTSLDHLRSRWTLGQRPLVVLAAAATVGLTVAVLHAAFVEHGYRRFMLAYLVAFAFVLSLSLGGLFFVVIQHLARAGWSVLVRRPAEALAANVLVVSLLFLPIAFSVLRGGGEIYPWAQSASMNQLARHDEPAARASASAGYEHQRLDRRTLAKRAQLNPPWFVGRWAILLAVWAFLSLRFWRLSVGQDTTADPATTVRMERLAPPAALFLGLILTLGAFDLLMSLNPHWYSTILGIYYFSGAAVGGLSAIILLVIGLQRAGALPRAIGESHYLDLGRLLFGFTFFWAYIAFSQYMLLWYANLPETTSWLRIRGLSTASGDASAWSIVALVLLFGHFVLPFLGLMSRHVKRRPVLLAAGALWMLLMHYLDLAWIVLPELGPKLHLGLVELGLLVAVLAIYGLGLAWRLRPYSLIPLGDPRLSESAMHESAY